MEPKPTIKLRPSSANLHAKCAASAHGEGDKLVIHWDSGAGRLGTALHAWAKARVLGTALPAIDELATANSLDENQKRELVKMTRCVGKYCDEQLFNGGWSKNLVVEQPIGGTFETDKVIYDIGGTMDVGGLSADVTIFGTIDWKTTRLQAVDYSPQQMIYLRNAKNWVQANLPPKQQPKYYQYHVVFVRDWTEEISAVFTADELDAWVADFIQGIESWNGREYRPGGHCLFCPRQADCPAIYALVGNIGRALKDDGQFQIRAEKASDEELVRFYIASTAVAGMIGNAKDLLKALVVGRGGELLSGEGVLTTSTRTLFDIDPLKAWPICAGERCPHCNHWDFKPSNMTSPNGRWLCRACGQTFDNPLPPLLTDQEMADATRLSKTELLDAVGDHAAKGLKKTAKDAFWKSLEEADCVTPNPSLVLSLKKARTVQNDLEQ